MASGVVICTPDNIPKAVTFLKSELYILGCTSIPSYNSCSPIEDKELIVSLVNVAWSLASQHRKDVERRKDLPQLELKWASESKELNDQVLKSEQRINHQIKQLCSAQELCRRAQNDKEKAEGNLKVIKKEIASLKFSLQSIKTQMKHDVRKHEDHIIKLKNQILHRISGDISPRPATGNQISQFECKCMAKPQPASAKLLENNSEIGKMYKKTIHQLETNLQQLVLENVRLRKYLYNLHCQLLTAATNFSLLAGTPLTTDYSLPQHLFEMPIGLSLTKIELRNNELLTLLKNLFEKTKQISISVQ